MRPNRFKSINAKRIIHHTYKAAKIQLNTSKSSLKENALTLRLKNDKFLKLRIVEENPHLLKAVEWQESVVVCLLLALAVWIENKKFVKEAEIARSLQNMFATKINYITSIRKLFKISIDH